MTVGQWILFVLLLLAVFLAILLPVTLVNKNADVGGMGQGAGSGTYDFMVPAGVCDPNPPPGPTEGYAQVRTWSNDIFHQPPEEDLPDARDLSTYAWAWGQFIDHEIVRSGSDTTGKPPLVIPFSPGFNLTMSRLETRTGAGTGCHEIATEISAYIDGTTVYSDYRDLARMDALRSHVHGRLTMQAGGFLPYTDGTQTNFLAGDTRAGEHAILASLHTLFAREHNRWCEIMRLDNPTWTDDQLYFKARSYVIGIIQRITWEEWLPALLGSQNGLLETPPDGSPEELFPGTPKIATEFDVVTYRFGHSMVGNHLGSRQLVDLFFNAALVVSVGIDEFLRDAVLTPSQRMDAKVVDTLRNNLFGPPTAGMGEDLISRNMARSIEIGMASYEDMRALYGIGPEWPLAPSDQRQLAFIGTFAEPLVSGSSLPRTIAVSVAEQFRRIRRYDPYWYALPESQTRFGVTYAPLVNGATLRDVVVRNTGLDAGDLGHQSNLFFVP